MESNLASLKGRRTLDPFTSPKNQNSDESSRSWGFKFSLINKLPGLLLLTKWSKSRTDSQRAPSVFPPVFTWIRSIHDGPWNSTYSIWGLFKPWVLNLSHSFCKPVPKAEDPHSQVYQSQSTSPVTMEHRDKTNLRERGLYFAHSSSSPWPGSHSSMILRRLVTLPVESGSREVSDSTLPLFFLLLWQVTCENWQCCNPT